jgi:hypothetical protein
MLNKISGVWSVVFKLCDTGDTTSGVSFSPEDRVATYAYISSSLSKMRS